MNLQLFMYIFISFTWYIGTLKILKISYESFLHVEKNFSILVNDKENNAEMNEKIAGISRIKP